MFVPNDEAFDAAPNFNMTNLLINDTAIASKFYYIWALVNVEVCTVTYY